MKIWIAELRVFLDFNEEYRCEFTFEQDDKEYVFNEGTGEYVHFKDWFYTKVSSRPTVEPGMYRNRKVIQGFNRELSEGELLAVKEQMKKMLIKKLEQDLEYEIITYTHRIEAVRLEGINNEI